MPIIVSRVAATTLVFLALGVAGFYIGAGSSASGAYPDPPTYYETVLDDAPAGYWRFGEPSGTTQVDSSGHNNNGTYLGGVALGATGITGAAPNTAATYDGINDTSRIPDSLSLDVGNTFTAEGWIKRSAVTKTHELFNKGGNGLHIVVMAASSSNQVLLRRANVGTLAKSSVPVLADGAYHHIVVTLNGLGSSAKIYIDGVDVTTIVAPGQTVFDTAFLLTMGAAASTAAQYDEFALYDTVLTPDQVAEHYALGVGTLT